MAGHAEINLADLADADWILARPGVPCWQLAREACERAGFVPRARHYADEFIGVVGLVAAGHGVSLLPRLAQPEFVNEPIVLRPVAGVSPVRRIGAQIRAGTADQPHIAPVLASLRKIAAGVALGPVECRAKRAVPDTPAAAGGDVTSQRATTKIALIRGINVGTAKRVAMADLRKMLTGLGYADVRTLLNSGNAVFATDDSSAKVTAAIEHGLREDLKVPARVLVRTRAQVVAAMAADPLGDTATDGSKHFLGFLDSSPTNPVGDIAELARGRRHGAGHRQAG